MTGPMKPTVHNPTVSREWVTSCTCGFLLIGDDHDEALSEMELHQFLYTPTELCEYCTDGIVDGTKTVCHRCYGDLDQ